MLVVTIYSLDVACAECCSNRCCSYFYFSTGCIVAFKFLEINFEMMATLLTFPMYQFGPVPEQWTPLEPENVSIIGGCP